ncbi:hypothetical protein KKG41_06915 [Patescibacteria group bacterium]|nr:hypothetical protein [Patescibacteria group bacterium]MBU1890458.1 hypothetical protein [Patescibacteria group bacterium]
MGFTYGEILKKAWRIVWRHKFLWFFGLFLVTISQEIEMVVRNYSMYTEQKLSVDSWRSFFENDLGSQVISVWDAMSGTTAGSVMLLLLFLVVFVIVVWLTAISIGAIIHNAIKAESGKTITFNEGFDVGRKHIKKNFLIYLIAKVSDYVVLLLIGLIASLVVTGVIGTVVSVIFVIISFIVSLIISFVAKYAACYTINNNQDWPVAIRSGWRLFIKNWVASVEMAIIIFFISILVSLAMFLVFVLIIVPFIILVFILNQTDVAGLGGVFMNIMTIILLMIAIVVGSVMSSFQFSAWALFFLKLNGSKKTSKILLWAERLFGRKANKKIA